MQRGSNENTNGLLRKYFPKGTDLSAWTSHHLDHVAADLNNRPRKCLNEKSPHQTMQQREHRLIAKIIRNDRQKPSGGNVEPGSTGRPRLARIATPMAESAADAAPAVCGR